MSMKVSVLVYEFISGGGLAASEGAAAAATPAPGTGLLAQGMAMRDALAADLEALPEVALACACAPYAPLPHSLARAQPVVAPAGLDPAAFLAHEAGRYDRVWVIAPECDGVLAGLCDAVGPGRWVGCAPSAIGVASSKAATRTLLEAHGIAVPASWCPGEPEPPAGSRWVVKPDDGAGCVATRLHESFPLARGDLRARLALGTASTLERWVDGSPLSLSLLCADGRAELLSINRQRIAVRPDGLVAYGGVDRCPSVLGGPDGRRLAALAQRVAAAVPGLAGYVGVDLVWPSAPGQPHPPGPVVIEINPRLTCAYAGLSAALGRNLAGEILRARHPELAAHALH